MAEQDKLMNTDLKDLDLEEKAEINARMIEVSERLDTIDAVDAEHKA